MARRRGRHHRRSMKLPIISLAILGGQAAYAAANSGGNFLNGLNAFQELYTGVSVVGTIGFHPEKLLFGYGPWLAKRFLMPIARPRIPGVSLPVSLS